MTQKRFDFIHRGGLEFVRCLECNAEFYAEDPRQALHYAVAHGNPPSEEKTVPTVAVSLTPAVVRGGQGGFRIRNGAELADEQSEIDRLHDENSDLRRRLSGYEG